MLPVTCHQGQQPQSQTLLLQTPPLYTVGWFAKTVFCFVLGNQPIYPKTQTNVNPKYGKIFQFFLNKFPLF